MRPLAARALLLALACALAAPAAVARTEEKAETAVPTIYKWVDANGVAHYTTELSRVPRSVRDSVRALGSGSPPASEGFATRDTGAGEAAPAVAPLPEWDVGDAPPPAPPPAPAAAPATAPGGSGDRWAESDRPFDLPGEEQGAAPGAATQTASAQPSEAAAPPSAAQVEAQREDLDARIAALEAEIASDEDKLKSFLAVPSPDNTAEIAYDQSFREVAARLPGRLAELRGLKGERAQLEAP